MATGAEKGFFGPTNKENAVGGKRSNFLTGEEDKVHQPVFGPKKPGKKRKETSNQTTGDQPPRLFKKMGIPLTLAERSSHPFHKHDRKISSIHK